MTETEMGFGFGWLLTSHLRNDVGHGEVVTVRPSMGEDGSDERLAVVVHPTEPVKSCRDSACNAVQG